MELAAAGRLAGVGADQRLDRGDMALGPGDVRLDHVRRRPLGPGQLRAIGGGAGAQRMDLGEEVGEPVVAQLGDRGIDRLDRLAGPALPDGVLGRGDGIRPVILALDLLALEQVREPVEAAGDVGLVAGDAEARRCRRGGTARRFVRAGPSAGPRARTAPPTPSCRPRTRRRRRPRGSTPRTSRWPRAARCRRSRPGRRRPPPGSASRAASRRSG